mmetsp:Transcript_16798/g.45929  ORF Transcript_16798/g.45929 Transcript_16798/m.45929 type:complete len:225 (-) Transcript_16798:12-686(-)
MVSKSLGLSCRDVANAHAMMDTSRKLNWLIFATACSASKRKSSGSTAASKAHAQAKFESSCGEAGAVEEATSLSLARADFEAVLMIAVLPIARRAQAHANVETCCSTPRRRISHKSSRPKTHCVRPAQALIEASYATTSKLLAIKPKHKQLSQRLVLPHALMTALWVITLGVRDPCCAKFITCNECGHSMVFSHALMAALYVMISGLTSRSIISWKAPTGSSHL